MKKETTIKSNMPGVAGAKSWAMISGSVLTYNEERITVITINDTMDSFYEVVLDFNISIDQYNGLRHQSVKYKSMLSLHVNLDNYQVINLEVNEDAGYKNEVFITGVITELIYMKWDRWYQCKFYIGPFLVDMNWVDIPVNITRGWMITVKGQLYEHHQVMTLEGAKSIESQQNG